MHILHHLSNQPRLAQLRKQQNVSKYAYYIPTADLIDLTYFVTANNSISSVAFKTGTTHGSCRGCGINLASGMFNTWGYS
jgi:hypothetical protein